MKNIIINQIQESIDTKKNLINLCLDDIQYAAELMIDCVNNKGKILWCGNGGSAAEAQHLSTELMGGMMNKERKPIPSIALTTDTSFLTAWTNDTDFDSIFSRQVQAIGIENDILVGISTSGKSENVINAIKQAKFKNLKTIFLTGENENLNNIADLIINVPSSNTQRIQESHIMIGQILCSLLEANLIN